MKKVKNIQPKIVIFTAVKNRCMLHGRVFVMRFGDILEFLKNDLNPKNAYFSNNKIFLHLLSTRINGTSTLNN